MKRFFGLSGVSFWGMPTFRAPSSAAPTAILVPLALLFLGSPAWSQEDPWATPDNPNPTAAPVQKAAPWTPPPGTVEEGTASYYADKYQGRLTASGVPFDQKKFTAAHKRLAFGTRVLVANAANGKSVEVVINDRGPFITGRIIDLTKAAALEIGLTEIGIAPVTMTVLAADSAAEAGPNGLTAQTSASETSVQSGGAADPQNPLIAPIPLPGLQQGPEVFFQAGSYRSLLNAQALIKKLRDLGLAPRLRRENEIHRVFVAASAREEEKVLSLLKKAGVGEPQRRSTPPEGIEEEVP